MSAGLFKVVDSKSKQSVADNKSFGDAFRLAEKHNNDQCNVSKYKVLAQ